jgi:hypothetical protein
MIQLKQTEHWSRLNIFVKNQDDTWTEVKNIHIKTEQGWKPVWKYSWEVGTWGECSEKCGGGEQVRDVTCLRSDGIYKSDRFCSEISKPASVQECNTGPCGSYATVTRLLHYGQFNVNGNSFGVSVGGTYLIEPTLPEGENTLIVTAQRPGLSWHQGTIIDILFCKDTPEAFRPISGFPPSHSSIQYPVECQQYGITKGTKVLTYNRGVDSTRMVFKF